jgi:HSP20 family protein
MTANRPRRSHRADDLPLTDAFFSGLYAPGSRWLAGRPVRTWRPPTDVYETESQIVVQMEVAGMRRDDFYITLEDRRLTISGIRANSPSSPGAYHQMEVNFGEFRSEVELPGAVEVEGIEAEYEDGFLRVTLPKAKPRRVEIR